MFLNNFPCCRNIFLDRGTRLRGQVLIGNKFGSILQSFRVIFYNSTAPAAVPPTTTSSWEPGSSNSNSWELSERGEDSWNLTAAQAQNTALSSAQTRDSEPSSNMADSWDFEDDVEEFQLEKITELRKEEERKERKRIRERDKVLGPEIFNIFDC